MLWVGLSVLVIGLVARTVVEVCRHEICVPDAAVQGLASVSDEPAGVEEPARPEGASGVVGPAGSEPAAVPES